MDNLLPLKEERRERRGGAVKSEGSASSDKRRGRRRRHGGGKNIGGRRPVRILCPSATKVHLDGSAATRTRTHRPTHRPTDQSDFLRWFAPRGATAAAAVAADCSGTGIPFIRANVSILKVSKSAGRRVPWKYIIICHGLRLQHLLLPDSLNESLASL